MKRRVWAALALLVLAPAAGCRQMAQNPSPGGVVAVTVRNNYAGNVEVWMLHDGTREHIGLVLGTSAQTFTIRGGRLVSGRIRLVGEPVGGTGRAFSGPLTVSRGENVTFTIQPVLANSYAEVR